MNTENRKTSTSRSARRTILLAIAAMIAISALAAYSAGVSADTIKRFVLSSSAEGGISQTPVSFRSEASSLTAPEPLITTTSGSLLTARSGHTATALDDGRVLITGGDGVGSSEIYDPASGLSVSTGNLNAARSGHTATRLADGRVFISGGTVGGAASATTEIYDPSTGAFSVGPSMASARSGHTATTLSDGRIFIAGGDAAGSAEIYDPAANTFSSVTAAMTAARRDHSAVRMADGRVLIVGGTSFDAGNIRTGEIFDAATSTFSQVGNSTADEHIHALLRLLPDGKVQIIGGTDHGDIEIYDPSINQFGAHSHVFPNGDSHPELVQQILDSPTRAALFYYGASGALLDREGHTITEITGSNQALVAGGTDSSNNVLNSVSVLSSSPATITTDKLDYAPGTPVVVSGTGFAPNETVTLTFHEDPHPPTENPHTFTVTTDANGNFTDQQYAPEDADVGVAYILAAVGGATGRTAQTAFTDARNWILTFAGTGSGSVTITPSAGTVNAPVTCGGTGVPAASQTVTSTCSPNITTSISGATITLSAAANSGSNFTGWSGIADFSPTTCSGTTNPCTGVAGSSATVTVTFNGNANTSTTVASSANPSTFGNNVTFTASVKVGVTAVTTGSVTFIEGANCAAPGIVLSGPTVLNGSGQAAFSTSTLTVPTHTITACYGGGSGFNTSSGSVTQTVNKADQTITFGALPNKTYGDSAFIVSAAGGASGNSVTFSSTATAVCTTGGTNGSTVTIIAVGTCSVKASQLGNSNYNAAADVTQSFTVNQKSLTPSITASNKQYDGTTAASFTCSLTGIVGSDDVTCTGGTANFDTASVGAGKTVTATGLTLSGTKAANYVLSSTSATTTANVTSKAITATLTAADKPYDGNTTEPNANMSCSVSGVLAGDTLNVACTPSAGSFNSKDVATANQVTATVTISGSAAGNYTLGAAGTNISSTSATATAHITAVTLMASIINNPTKTYDGTTAATLSPSNFQLTGLVGTESFTVTKTIGTYNNSNVALATTVSTTLAPGDFTPAFGTLATNYVLPATASGPGAILKANAVINVTGFSGAYTGDPHCATGTAVGVEATPADLNALLHLGSCFTNVPGGTANWAFDGNGNYNATTGSVNIVITAKKLTIDGAVAQNKPYDGNNTATVDFAAASLNGVIAPDVVTINSAYSATFASIFVADNIDVTVTGVVLGGAQAGNYTVSQPTGLKANITKLKLTISGAVAQPKAYDGGPDAVVDFTAATLHDPITGDDVSLDATAYAASFNTKDVGTAKAVTVTGVTLQGAAKDNYTVSQPEGLKADVNRRTLTASILNDPTKTYDAGDTAFLAQSNFSIANLVSGESFAVTKTTGTYNSPDVATATTVSTTLDAGDFTPDIGTLASNYDLPTAATGMGHITPATPVVNVTGGPFIYDATPHSAIVTVTGVLNEPVSGSSTVTYNPPGSAIEPVDAGTYGVSVSFASSNSNYKNASGSGSILINKATSTTTVTFEAGPYTYRGTPFTATAAATGIGGLNQALSVSYSGDCTNVTVGGCTASATFADDNNHLGSNDSKSITIVKAASTTTVTCPTNVTYTSVALEPCSANVTGAGGLNIDPFAVSYSDNIDAGTAHASASYAGDQNHDPSSDAKTFTIDKASTVTAVTCAAGPFVYNGSAFTPCSATVTGPGLSQSLTVNYTNNTDAGTATASAGYAETANLFGSGDSKNFTIDKASSTVTVTCPASVVYNGSAQTPCSASATGAGGLNESLTVVYGNNTNAGTAAADATFSGDANHLGNSGSATFEIAKAPVTATAGSGSTTYDGSTHSPSACTVVGSPYAGDLTCTNNPASVGPDAGTTIITPDVTGTGLSNFDIHSINGTYVIGKASTTTVVTFEAGPYVYSGTAFTATAQVTGNSGPLNTSLSVSYTGDCTNVTVGGCTASATYPESANYFSSSDSKTIFIAAATPTLSTTGGTFTFDGNPHSSVGTASGIDNVTPVSGSFTYTYTPPGNGSAPVNASAVPYSVSANFTSTDPNYNNGVAATNSITISQASSTTTVTCPPDVVFTGSPLTPCTASYSGVGISGSLTPSYLNNINPGTATASASYVGDANHTGSTNSANFMITNNAVVNLAVSSAVINEGGTATLTISFEDADPLQSHTGTINWGDGSGSTSLGLIPAGIYSINVSRTFTDDNPTATASDVKNVSVTVSDGAYIAVSPTINGPTVTINNMAPTIASIAGAPAAPVQINTPVSLTINFADTGVQDTHTCSFNWDDTTPSAFVAGTVTETMGSGVGTCTGAKTFTVPGVYTILISVKDDDTGTVTRGLDSQYVVVFDPSGGFVTGGGWIMSPAGASTQFPTATGKANFGFVSKYKKGSNTPDGQTEFQFQAGNLNFHSSSYDVGSLVVSGYKAQYKGVGDINGVPGYKFILTAYDGDINGAGNDGVDKFRIKILDAGNNVVYDNRMNASDDIDFVPMAISGGSINIQKPGK